MFALGWEVGEWNENECVYGSFKGDEDIIELDCGSSHTTHEDTKTTEVCTLNR